MVEVKRARRKEEEQHAARAKAESDNKATEEEKARIKQQRKSRHAGWQRKCMLLEREQSMRD